ncbi:MAG: hypothetical protein M0Z84_12825 [Gammaproteobacteria bacterium]|nr:hypothetical protein [Gammaproteobacteria bacterium]
MAPPTRGNIAESKPKPLSTATTIRSGNQTLDRSKHFSYYDDPHNEQDQDHPGSREHKHHQQ